MIDSIMLDSVDLFTYGTLKRGQPNYSLLTDSTNGVAKWLGATKLVNKYPLVYSLVSRPWWWLVNTMYHFYWTGKERERYELLINLLCEGLLSDINFV